MSSMFGPNKYGDAPEDPDDTGWLPLTLVNGWVAYGSGYPEGQYRKLNGVVYVRGLIKSGTITDNTTLATLPVGFRPALLNRHMSITYAQAGTFARIDVATDGTIVGADGLDATFTSITLTPFIAEQ